MDIKKLIQSWPVYRQITGEDALGRGKAAQSARSAGLTPRTAEADHVAHSVCPYCAVGCAQNVYVKDGKVVQIEGNPDSPISRGRLCPKGSASKQLVTGPQREQKVRYRPPYATEWQELDLDTAMDMVADRVLDARQQGLAGLRRRPQHAAPHHGHRESGRRDAGQRRELSDQEALHRAGRAADREPSPYLTQRHGSRSGSLLRSRRGDGLSSKTSSTRTSSSSWARTWPRPIRSGSSG